MFKDLKFKKSVKFCCTKGSCPEFKMTEDGWIVVFDDFGNSIKIPADKAAFEKVYKELFLDK
jgi:hypothetical protein